MRERNKGKLELLVEKRTKELVQTQEATLNILEDLEETNEALETSRASFRSIVEKNTDGIIIVDGEGIVRFINPMVKLLFGQRGEKLVGELFGFPVVKGESTELNIVRASGKSGTGEMRVVETEWENKRAHLVSIRDITKEKEIDRMKTEFISTVSHELRTPLAAIKNVVTNILDGIIGQINEKQRDHLHIADKEVDRLTRIIGSLLDISRIEAGRVELRRTLVDITTLANNAIASLKAEAGKKRIRIDTSYRTTQPDVFVDPDRITQVFNGDVAFAIIVLQQAVTVGHMTKFLQ